MTILFEPKYNLGDIVHLKIDLETKYIINSYTINQINEEGEVLDFQYAAYDKEGKTLYFYERDLELIESISQ